MKKQKLATDLNKKAKSILDIATGENTTLNDGKNPAAVALGKLGGLKGGKARANSLSAEQRKEIAKKAAAKRWSAK